jgi:Bacterial mobilisation protein (MobC)
MANQRRPDLINVSTHIDRETERAFDAWARTRGGKAAALRILIRDAVGAPVPDRAPADAGVSDLHVRLSEPEREALRQAAAQKGMAPSKWVRSLVRAHVLRRPQWGEFERQGFAAVLTAVARIGSNVNQIARAMNVAVLKGEYAARQGSEVREAAGEVKRAIAQLAGMIGRDLDYWGADTKAEFPVVPRRTLKRGTRAPGHEQ